MRLISAFFMICIFLCETPLISHPSGSHGIMYGDGMMLPEPVDGLASTDHYLSFADSLFDAGDYYVASIEYERAYYLSDNQYERVHANLAKVDALKQMGEFEKARNDIQRSLPHANDPDVRFQVLYEWAFCAYMSGIYKESLLATQQIGFYFDDQKHRDEAALLHALSLMQLEKWDDLLDHLNRWTSNYLIADGKTNCNHDIQQLTNALMRELNKDNRPKIKDPERARLYSTLMPGLGHMYAGEVGKASLNVFSQALSLGGAALLAFNGYYISTFTLGLGLFQSFYFGGIKQAGNLTSLRNNRAMGEYKQEIGSLLIDLDNKLQYARNQSIGLAVEMALEETLLALYDFDFKKAELISSRIQQKYPDQYLAHFSKTNYLWWLIISQPFSERSENQYRESISHSMSLARKRTGEAFLDQDLFYLISLYAMHARLDLKNGAYIRAMRNSRNAISHIELSIGREDDYQGFLLTSGLYNYMTIQATRKYPFLKIYGIFYPEGNRELGLTQLKQASQNDYLIWSTEANYFLMRLYLEMEEDPDQALPYAEWLTLTYPSNLIYQYYHLIILRELGDKQIIQNKEAEIRFAAMNHEGISEEQRDYFLELIDN